MTGGQSLQLFFFVAVIRSAEGCQDVEIVVDLLDRHFAIICLLDPERLTVLPIGQATVRADGFHRD